MNWLCWIGPQNKKQLNFVGQQLLKLNHFVGEPCLWSTVIQLGHVIVESQ
jgi:hypothetical protein